jgi:hypothetical protein
MFQRLTKLSVSLGALVALAAAGGSMASAASAAPSAPRDPNLFASVNPSGTLAAATPGTHLTVIGIGRYEVTFRQNVSRCAYVATTINAYSQALQAYTAGGHLSNNGVYVETKNQGGGLTAGPFNLVVDCGQPGWSYAVVGYQGNLVRATRHTRLTSLGIGRYDVKFPYSVRGCAYLASVGDPGHSLVYNPAGVYTGSSTNSHVVYIETKNPGGGLSAGIPFQLAVVCSPAIDAHFAVVNASGLPARGSQLTSSYSSSTGLYTMVTNASLAACAEVATRGSVNTAVPYSPTTVEIVPGPAINTIGIQVRNLLFFGGALTDQSFHIAAVC